ncbi:MAG: helix-turn-helix transcriptional regulator [Phascolarctobacterium sp.]|nr:helix-turn-helix transcriptional regulator [Candidatus Phascolarctobacterium caballi]
MFEEEFVKRLTELRIQKKVSARSMSLSIGQSPNYIFGIESGKTMPSMSAFFFICDYLGVTPSEFFNTNNANPKQIQSINQDLLKLDFESLEHLSRVVHKMAN